MIATLIALAVAAQGQQLQAPTQADSQSPQSATALISKMFKLYADATSLTGTIHMKQAMGSTAISLDTDIAFQSPNKIFLKQVLKSTEPKSWLVTSDGNAFTYDVPNKDRFVNHPPTNRLMEAVTPAPGRSLSYRETYRAASFSLGDRSLPEDLAIAGTDELQAIRDQIASVEFTGTQKLGDLTVNVLSGDWREYGRAPVSAKFQMYLTEDGQLKRYARREILSVDLKNGTALPPAEVITIWDVDLKINAKPDESLFAVVR